MQLVVVVMVLWPQSSYACWYLLFWTNCDESIETEHEIRLEFDATETVAAISEEIRKRSLDVPIERHIIASSKDAILEIEKQVFLDLHSLLDKAYKIAHDIIEDVACATEGTSKEIMREARSYFPKIVNPFDRCRKKLNLWLHRTELGPLQVFILRECKQLEPLDKRDTPVKSIIAAYSALEHQAEQLRCVSKRTEFESDKLLRYSTKYAYKARFWDTLAR